MVAHVDGKKGECFRGWIDREIMELDEIQVRI